MRAIFIRWAVLDAHNSHLVDRPVARQGSTLGLGHVLARAAPIGFVRFGRFEEHGLLSLKRLAQPVRQIPRCPLHDLQAWHTLHAADALEFGGQQVDVNGPYPIAEP